MISEVVAYAANRATGGAVDSISRRAGWYAAGGVVFLFGAMFAIMAAFWYLEPRYGTIESAAFIAGACVVAALLCFAVPTAVEAAKQRKAKAELQAAAAAAGTGPLGLGLGRLLRIASARNRSCFVVILMLVVAPSTTCTA